MKFADGVTNEVLDLNESISRILLTEIQLNDSKRFLAGLRRPSRLHRDILQDLSDIRAKRAKINSVEATWGGVKV